MDLDRIVRIAEKQIRKVLGKENPGMWCSPYTAFKTKAFKSPLEQEVCWMVLVRVGLLILHLNLFYGPGLEFFLLLNYFDINFLWGKWGFSIKQLQWVKKKKKYINFKRQQKWDTHEITITAVGSLHINSTGGGCTISKFGRKDWQISNMIVIYNMRCIENNDLKK